MLRIGNPVAGGSKDPPLVRVWDQNFIKFLAWFTAIDAGSRLIARFRIHVATGLLHCAITPNWREVRTMRICAGDAALLVVHERILNCRRRREAFVEDDGVFDGLGRPLPEVRSHRMRSVTE